MTFGAGQGDLAGQPLRLVGVTLGYLPACLVRAGPTAALLGRLPRAAVAATWTALALVVVLDLPAEFRLVTGALLDLSPFRYTARTLDGPGDGTVALVVLTLAAVALGAFGLLGFRRRDLA